MLSNPICYTWPIFFAAYLFPLVYYQLLNSPLEEKGEEKVHLALRGVRSINMKSVTIFLTAMALLSTGHAQTQPGAAAQAASAQTADNAAWGAGAGALAILGVAAGTAAAAVTASHSHAHSH